MHIVSHDSYCFQLIIIIKSILHSDPSFTDLGILDFFDEIPLHCQNIHVNLNVHFVWNLLYCIGTNSIATSSFISKCYAIWWKLQRNRSPNENEQDNYRFVKGKNVTIHYCLHQQQYISK